MYQAQFHFHGELNDFLPPGRRFCSFCHTFKGNPSVKHLIEALGVPHPEVQRVLTNGRAVDLSYRVQDGDCVEVFPSQRGQLSLPARFVLDNHLGRLAAYLRMLGFDTLYQNNFQDGILAHLSHDEGRILLTRDIQLLMHSIVTYGRWIRSKDPKQQIIEVIHYYNLYDQIKPFRRCLHCNGVLQPVEKAVILDRLEPLTKKYYNDFHICPNCHQIYWQGSHYERMQSLIDWVQKERL